MAQDGVDSGVLNPEGIDPATRTSWIGAFILCPPIILMHHLTRLVNVDFVGMKGVKQLPVLYIHGKDDACLNHEPILKYVKSVYQNVEAYVLDSSGHTPFYEKPEEVKSKILGFMSKLEAAAIEKFASV